MNMGESILWFEYIPCGLTYDVHPYSIFVVCYSVVFEVTTHFFLSEAAAGAVSPVAEESEEVGVCTT